MVLLSFRIPARSLPFPWRKWSRQQTQIGVIGLTRVTAEGRNDHKSNGGRKEGPSEVSVLSLSGTPCLRTR